MLWGWESWLFCYQLSLFYHDKGLKPSIKTLLLSSVRLRFQQRVTRHSWEFSRVTQTDWEEAHFHSQAAQPFVGWPVTFSLVITGWAGVVGGTVPTVMGMGDDHFWPDRCLQDRGGGFRTAIYGVIQSSSKTVTEEGTSSGVLVGCLEQWWLKQSLPTQWLWCGWCLLEQSRQLLWLLQQLCQVLWRNWIL